MIFEILFRSISEALSWKRRKNPILASIGYLLLGVVSGALSLIFFPKHSIYGRSWRLLNLLLTPILVGLCMSAWGNFRENRGLDRIRLDSFSYGFVFALGMALIRYFFTTE
ncbi:hypothetical protein EPO44_20765 [bacterium]|nr:MAG: hypothetical protein EPO44_20765 [bacterium]